MISQHGGSTQAALTERGVDQFRDFFFLQCAIDCRERQAFRQNLGQDSTAYRCFITIDGLDELTGLQIFRIFGDTNRDARGQLNFFVVIGTNDLGHIRQHQAFAFCIDLLAGRVIQTQHDILRRNDRRLAIRWEQNIVRCQHQCTCFHLRFDRQRHVNRHLVTVEVGIERRANQRMQLYRLTFDQNWLESLNAQTVQRRRTVQHDWVFANHVFQNIPDDWLLNFDQLLGCLDRGRQTHQLQFIEDERLEQF